MIKSLLIKLWFALTAVMLVNSMVLAQGVVIKRPKQEKEESRKSVKYQKAAEQGDAEAQYKLGKLYYDGDGVTRDYEEAVKWFRKAADQGSAEAQYKLGFMYDVGWGVPRDDKEAVKWYIKAAKQEHVKAQVSIGDMYFLNKNYKEGLKWYMKVVDKDAFVQNNLGLMHYKGQGVTQDIVTAYAWFSLAESNGFEPAKKNKAVVSKKLTPQQLKKAQKLAKEFVKKIKK